MSANFPLLFKKALNTLLIRNLCQYLQKTNRLVINRCSFVACLVGQSSAGDVAIVVVVDDDSLEIIKLRNYGDTYIRATANAIEFNELLHSIRWNNHFRD